jgi:hypothetical protein
MALIGCATTHQTETLLSEAGFKAVPAATAAQQSHLNTLPPDKITRVQRQGKTYYAFPDPARKVLYIGQEAEYKQYQNLCRQHESSSPGLTDAQINNEPGWGPWVPWVGSGLPFE